MKMKNDTTKFAVMIGTKRVMSQISPPIWIFSDRFESVKDFTLSGLFFEGWWHLALVFIVVQADYQQP